MAAIVGLLLPVSCDQLKISRYYEQGVVATVSPVASAIGQQVFEQGGNSFDAAVAVAFTLAVSYPQSGNLGGGGFAVMREGSSGDVVSLDFREKAPAAAHATMFLDDSANVIPGASTVGGRSSGVPGSVAGLYTLWQRYGTLPWDNLVRPAADLADSGIVVDSLLAADLEERRTSMILFEKTADLFYPNGQALRRGDRLVQKELAATLFAIAQEGIDPFYRGRIAEQIESTMQKHGGLITREDLAAYQPVWRTPIHYTFDSLDIYSMAPPSSGGIIMAQILKMVEPYDFSRFGGPDSPEYIHLFAEASRLAFADRSEHLGDPDFYKIPLGLLDSAYLSERRAKINRYKAGVSEHTLPGNAARLESDATTHFSICDKDGNMVAVTTTLNSYFGSCIVVDGAGFLMNNEMDDFSIKSGHANIYGLVGNEANRIEPGKRMLSSMSPTIVLQDNQPFLILGSPGGSKIITAVAQAILLFSRFGLSLSETVAEPRFHHQWLPDILYLEENEFGSSTIEDLVGRGHQVKERSHYGDLELIYIDPSGIMMAASDPRLGGKTAGY